MGERRRASYGKLLKLVTYYQEEAKQLESELAEMKERYNTLKAQPVEAPEPKIEQSEEQKQEVKALHKKITSLQTQLLEKEEGTQYLQAKAEKLEAQLKFYKKRFDGLQEQITHESNQEVTENGPSAIAYFRHSIFADGKRYMIHGNFIIENTGNETLHDPAVCIRILPETFATMKGSILTVERAEQNLEEPEENQWLFADENWDEKAKETGDIWLQTQNPVSLKPGERLVFEQFQIPVKAIVPESVSVDGFVYFQNPEYKIRSLNTINISF